MRFWEEDPSFRAFVEAERAAGRLSGEEIAAVAALPHRLHGLQGKESVVIGPLARARALFAASGAGDPRGDWSGWVLPARSSQGE